MAKRTGVAKKGKPRSGTNAASKGRGSERPRRPYRRVASVSFEAEADAIAKTARDLERRFDRLVDRVRGVVHTYDAERAVQGKAAHGTSLPTFPQPAPDSVMAVAARAILNAGRAALPRVSIILAVDDEAHAGDEAASKLGRLALDHLLDATGAGRTVTSARKLVAALQAIELRGSSQNRIIEEIEMSRCVFDPEHESEVSSHNAHDARASAEYLSGALPLIDSRFSRLTPTDILALIAVPTDERVPIPRTARRNASVATLAAELAWRAGVETGTGEPGRGPAPASVVERFKKAHARFKER